MAMIFTQGNAASMACSGGTELLACSGLTSGFAVGYIPAFCEEGGTPGTQTDQATVASSATTAEWAMHVVIPSGASWDAGDWTVRVNITTANMNLTISSIHICRVNSSCTNQETIGSATGLSLSLAATGVVSQVVSGSAVTPSAGDFVLIVFGLTNSAMSSQQATLTRDQDIDSPFTAVTQPNPNVNDSITVTESVSAMLNPMLFNVFDTVTLTEATQRNMLLFPQPFDEITVTESVNPNVVNNVSVFDTVTLTEDVRAHILVMPFVFDSVTVAESVTTLLTSLNISADDTVTLTESVSVTLNEGVAGLSVDIFDTVTVTEDARVHIFLMPTVNDSVTVTEATQRNMLLFPRPFDSVTVTDAPQLNMLVMPSVFDTVTTTESVTVSVVSVSAIQINAFDSITVADDSTVLLPWLALFVSDSITVTEDITVTESGVTPETTPATTSGGGYYRYFSAEEMSCKREIKALEKKEKEVVRQVKKLEQKIDDKQDEIAYARNMATLQRMINELEALHKKLEFMRKKLEEIEEEEMLLIATICQEYEQRLN